MNEFERRKQEAETVEIVSEVVLDDRARRQAGHDQAGPDRAFDGAGPAGGGFAGNGGNGGNGSAGYGGGAAFRDVPNGEDVAAIRTLNHILYGLYVLSIFTAGMAGIVALIIDYVRRPAMRGTVYATHSAWRTGTFWWALLGNLIGWALFLTHLGAMLVVVVSIWYIYRCAKGWLRLLESKPMNRGWF